MIDELQAMRALTVDTHHQASSSPSRPDQQSTSRSKSSSPVRPPYSPITPVLPSATLNTTASNRPAAPPQHHPRQLSARLHTLFPPTQTFIPPPPVPPEAISLDSNPDALALKAAISILQIQQRKATSDIQTLQNIKQRAVADPEAFAEALTTGQIRSGNDSLFNPTYQGTDDDDDDDEEDDKNKDEDEDENDQKLPLNPNADPEHGNSNIDISMTDAPPTPPSKPQPWPVLPKPQSVIRAPPINWNQYGVVGPSLDKIHADQLAHPMEGLPARVGPDGVAIPVEGGRRNEGLGIAAPYVPSRDKIEKKKGGGKRGVEHRQGRYLDRE